jgi:hypothetical protein
MSRWMRFIPIFVFALLVLACQLTPKLTPTVEILPPTITALPQAPTQEQPEATPTLTPTENLAPAQAPPVPTPTSTPTENPAATGPCQIVAAGDTVTAYTRPSLQADPFGQVSGAGFPILVGASTADGWLGFDPGVAQAANTGVFRYRWVLAAQVQVEGACDAVPLVQGPPPGICFTMPMDVTPVYTNPDNTSAVIVSLTVDQYAAVLGKTNNGWAKLDLGVGNSGVDQMGWVPEETLNFNGPCEALPIVTP